MMEARARVVVPAPAQFVYGHLAAMELYPQWVTDLLEVRRTGRRQRRWVLDGPEEPVQWDVEITVDEPGRRFGFCMEAPGLAGYTVARIHEAGPTTGLSVDRLLEAQEDRLRSWWGDADTRLRRDLWQFRTTLMRALEARSVPAPQGSKDLTRSLSGPSNASLFSN